MNAPEQRSRRPRRRLWTAVGVLAGLVVLALVAVFAVLVSANHKLDANVTREGLLPGQGQASSGDGSGDLVGTNSAGQAVDANGTTYVDAAGKPITIPKGYGPGEGVTVQQPARLASQGESMNLLVIGSDARGGEQGRSDVMILANISGDRKHVSLVHFPRDLWVQIPGRGSAKLNAAYAYGGAPLLIQTIQPMVGVPIDHAAIVNFDGFEQMTDAIGGVDLAGQHMSGAQALAWVRERKTLSQGDISRGERQMQFVKAVLLQALTPEVLLDPAALNRYLDAATSSLTVDQSFSTGDIRSLAVQMRGLKGQNVHMLSAPWLRVGWAGPQSIVVGSDEQTAVLRKALQTDSMATYEDKVSPKSGFGK